MAAYGEFLMAAVTRHRNGGTDPTELLESARLVLYRLSGACNTAKNHPITTHPAGYGRLVSLIPRGGPSIGGKLDWRIPQDSPFAVILKPPHSQVVGGADPGIHTRRRARDRRKEQLSDTPLNSQSSAHYDILTLKVKGSFAQLLLLSPPRDQCFTTNKRLRSGIHLPAILGNKLAISVEITGSERFTQFGIVALGNLAYSFSV